MSKKEKKTYGSKKNQSGIFRQRDVLRALPNTNTLFDALYSCNFKQVVKQKTFDISKTSEPKLKKTLTKKERNNRHNSRHLLLTDSSAEHSLRVNRNNSDPFDKLLESIQGADAAYCRLLSNSENKNFDPKINLTPDSSVNSLTKESSKDESSKKDVSDVAKSSAPLQPKKRKKKRKKIFLSPKNNKGNNIIDHRFHISKQKIDTSQSIDNLRDALMLKSELKLTNFADMLWDSELGNYQHEKPSASFIPENSKNKLPLPSKHFDLLKSSPMLTPRLHKVLLCSTPKEKIDAKSNLLPQDLSAIIISEDDTPYNKTMFELPNSPFLTSCTDTSHIETESPLISQSRRVSGEINEVAETSAIITHKLNNDPKLTMVPKVVIERLGCLKEFCNNNDQLESCENDKSWLPSDNESDFLGFTDRVRVNDEFVLTSPDMFESSESLCSLSSINSKKDDILSKLALFPTLNNSTTKNKSQSKKSSFKDNATKSYNLNSSVLELSDSDPSNSYNTKTVTSIVLRNKKSYRNSPNLKVAKKCKSNEYFDRHLKPIRKSTYSLRSLENNQIVEEPPSALQNSLIDLMQTSSTISNDGLFKSIHESSQGKINANDKSNDTRNIYVATRRKTTNFSIDTDDESSCENDQSELNLSSSIENIDISKLSIIKLENLSETDVDYEEKDAIELSASPKPVLLEKRSLYLQPGKKWARSLSILRNMNSSNYTFDDIAETLNETCKNSVKGRKYRESVATLVDHQMNMDMTHSRMSFMSHSRMSFMSHSRMSFMTNVQDNHHKSRLCSDTIVEEDQNQDTSDSGETTIRRHSIDEPDSLMMSTIN